MMTASYARSVNHYIILVMIPAVFLVIPPVLTAFGITHPLLDLFPGTALWYMIASAIGMAENIDGCTWLNLILWLGLLLFLADIRIGAALQSEGGKGA